MTYRRLMSNLARAAKRPTPMKIGQKVFREWCAEHKAIVDPFMAADLVKRIEREIVADRSNGELTAEKQK